MLPKYVLETVNQICKLFLWGSSKKKKVSLVSWEALCLPKKKGGMAVRDSIKWNIALVTKLV